MIETTSLVTFYREEEDLHPRFKELFGWYDQHVVGAIKPESDVKKSIILAGGALRSFFLDTKLRDWDIYLPNEPLKAFEKAPTTILGSEWRLLAETDLSWTFKQLVYNTMESVVEDATFNIIKKPQATPQDVITNYDFTVCMCAITADQITYHPDYFTDLATKTLRVNNLEDPLSVMWRLQKYNRYGFEIGKEDLWKIIEAIHEIDKLPTVVQEHGWLDGENMENKSIDMVFRAS